MKYLIGIVNEQLGWLCVRRIVDEEVDHSIRRDTGTLK